MTNVLVVTGSVRPNSVNARMVPLVANRLKIKGAEVKIADVGAFNLPFFDSLLHPMSPEFEPTHPGVVAWTNMVEASDAVVFVTPEYNHNPTPVQLNAVDWIAKEWRDKPVGIVAYGVSSGGGLASAGLRSAFELMKARQAENTANLYLEKDISRLGEVLSQENVDREIDAVIDQVLALVEAAVSVA